MRWISNPERFETWALTRSDLVAVGVNALNGSLVMIALALSLLPLFTPTVIILIGILLGPLFAFAISSLYVRIECAMGCRLGGNASLTDLYRIFAWTFLPCGFLALFCGFTLLLFDESSVTIVLFAASPFIVFALFSLRNYFINLVKLQGFSRKKGVVSLLLSVFFLLVVLGGAVSGLWLFDNYFDGFVSKSIWFVAW